MKKIFPLGAGHLPGDEEIQAVQAAEAGRGGAAVKEGSGGQGRGGDGHPGLPEAAGQPRRAVPPPTGAA